MSHLKLTIEPIPAGSRLASLAKLLPSGQWSRIRHEAYRKAGFRCQICGHEGQLHCHESWQYNEQSRQQWLQGFQALCSDCHAAKHLLFTHDSHLRARLVEHFMRVNHLTREQAQEYIHAARQRQQNLNQRQSTTNYGAYNWQMPPLAGLNQRQAFVKCMGSR